VALRRSVERRTGGRVTKPTAILGLPVVAATTSQSKSTDRAGQTSGAKRLFLGHWSPPGDASPGLCGLASGVIEHLGRSFSNSLEARIAMPAEKTRLQFRNKLFLFLDFRFRI
jgi:hypothetical protein